MSEEITANAGTVEETGTENPAREGSRTFTQDEVNSLLAKERRTAESKYAGFEDLKAKAEEFDKLQEANKTALEKANDKLAKATAELETLKAERERALIVAQVAKDTGVPLSVVEALNGADAETLMEQAKSIAEQYESTPSAPYVGSDGFAADQRGDDDDDWLRSALLKR